MKIDWREVAVIVAPGAVLAIWSAAVAAVIWATLDAPERAALGTLIEPRLALTLMLWLMLSGALGAVLRMAYQRWVAMPARLAEQVQALAGSNNQREIALQGSAEVQALTAAVNKLVRQRGELRADIEHKVRDASREIEQERSRLAALMSELTQSVVVCNLDGRILLYNARARLQFRVLSQSPSLADGAELIGLGRSIYAVFDRNLVAHALESVQQRLQRGVANPSAQFVTGTRGGQLLRVQLAPVRAIPGDIPSPGAVDVSLNGFVLMLDNITRDFAEQSQRDRMLHGLTEGSRASLGNLQAAVEMLDFPDLDAKTRERFQCVIRDEVNAMSQRIRELDTHTTQMLKTRWPMEDMLGADLLAAAARRIETLYGCRVALSEVDASLWLEVDSFSLLQALVFLAGRLTEDYAIRSVQLRLAAAGSRAHLDLVWSGQAMTTATVSSWEHEPMKVGADVSSLTVRDVVERHGGEFWCECERERDETFARFLLPLAGKHERLDTKTFVRGDSRPEYYDFDLFRASEQTRELADRKLTDLSYTVFDTETTGLDPSKGDEIIQIGATRIVNGKLRRQECFEQLVDPQRPIPTVSIPIHGIEPAMVAGQPTIAAVLPTFHAFAHDTVLVGHNVAFDMRFLQLKEERTGVRFDQPVLDTLLLSAHVHPQQESHQLEAIAERFDVAVLGRHSALGDAMVTAEVFLKLIPLLAEKGIHTLGEARDAARQTYYARLRY